MKITLQINGTKRELEVEKESSLLWVLRDQLKLTGTKYACGIASCGACMVHVDGQSVFSCRFPAASAEGKSITTIEGLAGEQRHPLQLAWVEEQVPQCGYCQSGQIMRAAELLRNNARPSRDEIVNHMNTNLCRCGTYPRIIRAIEKAAAKMRTGRA